MIWFDIILVAIVAAFLGWRLYSVLGERHGEERQRHNPYDLERTRKEREEMARNSGNIGESGSQDAPPRQNSDSGNQDAPGKDQPHDRDSTTATPLEFAPESLAGRLAAIQRADPDFDEKSFLAGARSAFEMIVTAFAAEDTATLRPLLSDDVYDSFAEAIRDRQARKEKLETRIVRISDISIEDASLQLNTAHITVRIVSGQVQFMRNADGEVISGDEKHSFEVIDLWKFTRNTRALNPNWQLSETRSGE